MGSSQFKTRKLAEDQMKGRKLLRLRRGLRTQVTQSNVCTARKDQKRGARGRGVWGKQGIWGKEQEEKRQKSSGLGGGLNVEGLVLTRQGRGGKQEKRR